MDWKRAARQTSGILSEKAVSALLSSVVKGEETAVRSTVAASISEGGRGGQAVGAGRKKSEQFETLRRIAAVCCEGSPANTHARPCVPLGGGAPPAQSEH